MVQTGAGANSVSYSKGTEITFTGCKVAELRPLSIT